MAEISVVICLDGHDEDVPHWCLWTLSDGGDELIFEALGVTGSSFHYNSIPVVMDKYASVKQTHRIGRIEADVWGEIPGILEGLPMSEETGWNCQNWVMQAINKLREVGYLEVDERGIAYLEEKIQEKQKTYY
ncbi:uncharacterized protein BDR25DRAFT_44365 [Lindgomyces ingoldianus]|uniref:Uncharacterized protein n=1 Tax=Lindgomyces ingoldianus TaxID=673940 RepID=A0ACB6RFH2_9PLEO|nr:uncharacterized protein BDR25DRAFT_44365 [Lindgomyces ingoldianus]KAF2477216.1 hypothetical protein BDR25DRAFT_44365 [Lindgomyces ingoldianus]